MFKWLDKKKIEPVYVEAGDTFILDIEDEHGNRETLLTENITQSLTIDEIGIFTFKNEFDMLEGIGGIFGKSIDSQE